MKNYILKSTLCFLIFLFNGYAQAQQLDPRFIGALPQDVRDQLQSEITDEIEKRSKENFRAPSTEIEKEQFKDDRERKEFERFQKSLSDSDYFGVSYFKTIQTTFMPVNEPVFDPEYILSVGDEIKIQLAGQQNDIFETVIERDGSISFPRVGKISIAGKKLSEIDLYIKSLINESFIGTTSYITLTSMRDMRILVVGEAEYPGIYTLPGNTNLLSALVAAGGPKETANLRKIQVRRDGETVRNIDLYEALIFGNFEEVNFPLKSADTIVLEASQRSVRIQGGVKRPGIYELLDDENLDDLLYFGNGFSQFAKKDDIQIISFEEGDINKRKYLAGVSQTLADNDTVSVAEYKTISVKVSGAVLNPGDYKVPINYNLSDIIEVVGGYEENAYPFGGVLLNKKAAEVEQSTLNRTKRDFLIFLSSKNRSASSQPSADLNTFLEQYENIDGLGRINAEFDLPKLRANPSLDLELSDEDELIIPRFSNTVYVFGEVANPGTHIFNSEKTANYYVDLSGGKTNRASKNLVLIHPNGDAEILESRFLFNRIGSAQQFVYPGSLVYVPRDFDLNPLEFANFYLPIVSNLAISLASIAAINNN